MYKLRGKQDLNKDLKSFSMEKTQKFPSVDFIKGIGVVRDSVSSPSGLLWIRRGCQVAEFLSHRESQKNLKGQHH